MLTHEYNINNKDRSTIALVPKMQMNVEISVTILCIILKTKTYSDIRKPMQFKTSLKRINRIV